MRTLVDLLFQNALIATDGLEINADLLVSGGTVRAIGSLEGVAADETIDCTGKTLLPGGVDLGLNLLQDGPFDLESPIGFAASAHDAALGGVTTLVSTIDLKEEDDVAATIRARADSDAGSSPVDFGYHLSIAEWNPARAGQCREALTAGVVTFHVLRTELGSVMPSPALLFAVLDDLPEGALVIATPFSATDYDAAAKKIPGGTPVQASTWMNVYTDRLEARLAAELGDAAATARCRLLVTGWSSLEGLRALATARERAPRLYGGATLAHLHFTGEDGAPRTWPPLRGKTDQQALWAALDDGLLSLVVSGHKPRRMKDTLAPAGNGKPAQVGVSALAHWYSLLHHDGPAKRRVTLGTLSQCAAADPAKLAGLYPRKGSLQPGSDADIVILDTQRERPAESVESSTSQLRYADPIGEEAILGVIEAVYLRGQRIVSQGKVEDPPIGQYLTRKLALK